jgi:alpha-galactosidase
MTLIGFQQDGLEKFAGPGHWNDPDMLEVGNGGMNRSEYEVHMSLWAMLSAPLLAGNDLSKMTPETKAILMNRDVIALDQDALGHQGRRIWAEGPMEIWVKELSGRKRAIALFNRGESTMDFDPDLKALADFRGRPLLNLWTRKELVLDGSPALRVPSHGVLLLEQR